MPTWADLLPGAPTLTIGMPGAGLDNGVRLPGDQPRVGIDRPLAGSIGEAFGIDKYVRLGRRALAAYQGWQQGAVHPRFDIMDAGSEAGLDDSELAKLIAQYGVIPADSDIGQLAAAAGARVFKQRVQFADGTHTFIDAVQIGSRKGGADRPEGRERRRRRNITSYRLGTAAWVMRKLHAQQRLMRRLAALAKRLHPTKVPKGKGRRK